MYSHCITWNVAFLTFRADVAFPSVEVRAEKLTLKAPALVGKGALPSVGRAVSSTIKVRGVSTYI